MNEQEWQECTDPTPMLEFLKGKASERQFRLFAVACCRRIWFLLKEASVRAVTAAEAYADGCVERSVLDKLSAVAAQAVGAVSLESEAAEYAATAGAMTAALGDVGRVAEAAAVAHGAATSPKGWLPGKWDEQEIQCSMLRDIFGPLPFCPVSVNPNWLVWNDGTVVKIAQTIYEERAFDRISILADALEAAGCDQADILSHCRSEGPHVRGCWLVDLVLGKE